MKGNEMGRACNMIGKKKNSYKVLAGKAEQMRPLGRGRQVGGLY
jgi:hypothetical protein